MGLFLGGLLFGSFIGMMVMSLMAINKINDGRNIVFRKDDKFVNNEDEVSINDCIKMNQKFNFISLIENGQVVDFVKE